MSGLSFNIKTTEKDFFTKIISLFKDFPPYNKLRNQEIFVLSRLMYYYFDISKNTKDVMMINITLFDSSYKNKIIEEMILEDEDGKGFEKAFAKFSNILTSLRQKGFILRSSGKNVLNTNLIFNPDKMREINFNFVINN